MTSRFGDRSDNWLGSLNGIATNRRGDVFVHDGKNGHIVALDEKLNVRRRIGRPGQGPGELTKLLMDEGMGGANTLAATNSTLYLANMSRVITFDLGGAFQKNVPGPHDALPIPIFKVRAVHAGPRGVLVGYWNQDSRSRAATLQTLLLGSAEPVLKHELPLPGSSGRGMTNRGPRHPRPLWAAYNDCVVVGNGSSSKLVRVNLATGRTDTLSLPEHTVPPFEVRAQTKRSEEAMRARGFDISLTAKPSELWRYAQLQIDPDGHVWVNPWFAKGAAPSPLTVYRIDPAGRVHLERLPAFPIAFGPAGVFYARGTNPDTDEILVIRYERGR